ncbi:nucleotidyltransferase domain-containing protein [Pseudolysinimonas sp.]|uniref:nucleotidyltransferase domain-containing protein n=1 Tax=Pseudolysinimonas sp. TaxID=2680009 RepID=UPI003784B71C
MTVPPFAPLRRVLDSLSAAGIPAVVGGSALLVAMGVDTEVRDWDVVTDADPEAVAAALRAAGLRAERSEASERYVSEALFTVRLDDAMIDVIVRFAVRADDGVVVRIPARPGTLWNELPMAHPDDWSAAYRAMGRPERAALLDLFRGGRA